MTGLVAAPAHVGAGDGDHRFRLQGAHHVVVAPPVVLLLLAVGTLAAGAVEPHGEDRPVMGQQLDQLVHVVVVVVLAGAFRRSVHLAQFPEDILVQSRAPVVVPQRLGVVALCGGGLLGKLPDRPVQRRAQVRFQIPYTALAGYVVRNVAHRAVIHPGKNRRNFLC